MTFLTTLKSVLLIASLALTVSAQTQKKSVLKWSVITSDSLSTLEVTGISLAEKPGERIALIRLKRGQGLAFGESLTFFHCRKRQTAAQIITLYNSNGTPADMKFPNELYKTVKRGSLDESALNFVCKAKIVK